jgi:hypothetical protein
MRTTLSLAILVLCSIANAQTSAQHKVSSTQTSPAKVSPSKASGLKVSPELQVCLDCHSSTTPGIVARWRESTHAKQNVDCYSCHKANDGDPATFDHYGKKIAVIVTPNYCGQCHASEQQQFDKSHHAAAAQFI